MLPVREMTLYKHGVGFFVRGGEVGGESVALTFRRDEINDVLKSLAVFDRAGGEVLGIHYSTPMDVHDRLANSSIRLSDRASLRDLLRDLRGRSASLLFETTPGTLETVRGRVIGLDEPAEYNMLNPPQVTVSILADEGGVRVFPFEALRSLTLHDGQSAEDLAYFLTTSMSESTSRTVSVRLSEGAHDLLVYYVAPSPTWRVSYRFVGETEGDSGKGVLQGWGLFDNRLEEDLEDVRVTLVAGQPISFIYELYASRIPTRPTVQDETRVAPAPVEYAASFEMSEPDELVRGISAAAPPAPQMARARLGLFKESALEERQELTPGMMMGTAAAQTEESGEFFQYVVTAPVSVKRGESALVPIIGAEIGYQRELLYNRAKMPDHPVAALRFMNTTGLTLERGPVTVVEDGDYRGEAIVGFTKAENEVYLPYAVELGVRVTERPISRRETQGLNIKGRFMVFEEYEVSGASYTLENTTARPLTVTIEAPIHTGWELFNTRPADQENARERRWRVAVEAKGRATFNRAERHLVQRREELRLLNYSRLEEFLRNRWLDNNTYNQLYELLDKHAEIERARARETELDKERNGLYKKQEQLRANVTTLQPTGQEAALRGRMLAQLEESQNRLEAIDREIVGLASQIKAAEVRIETIIASLS